MFTRLSLINGTVCKRQTESRRILTIRINNNRSIAMEQSVINYWGRSFNRFILQQPHPRFCCDSYTHRSCSVRVKDIYSSVNQHSELINQDSSLRWNKMCTQQQTNLETLTQQKSNSWTPMDPTIDRSSDPSQHNWNLYAGAMIKSEFKHTGVQLKMSAKLLTVIVWTTKHAVCRITSMLYPMSLL